jgi:peptidoglycan biosynthesis protein MviN/MurJ (putative lipid II flippase)
LYASHNTLLQVVASIVGFIAIVGVSVLTSGPLGIAAIPIGYVAGTAVKALLLGAFVRRRLALLPRRSVEVEAAGRSG